jgi:hypothetical protein
MKRRFRDSGVRTEVLKFLYHPKLTLLAPLPRVFPNVNISGLPSLLLIDCLPEA